MKKHQHPPPTDVFPKWTSLEFLFHLCFVLWCLGAMFYNNYSVTEHFHKELSATGLLVPGWKFLGNRLKDASDIQWRDFTNNLPILIIGMGCYVALGRVFRSVGTSALLTYYSVANVVVVIVLHGSRTFFMFVILFVHYILSHSTSSYRFSMIIIWTYVIAVLFLNEFNHGYSFERVFGDSWSWLDQYHGLYRWNVTFNMSILRMISFAGDLHEAKRGGADKAELERQKHRDCDDCIEFGGRCYSLRVATPRKLSEYSAVNYLAFVLYFPTYFAGPITCFNGWISHADEPQSHYSLGYIGKYTLRLVNMYVLLELTLHFAHINAIRQIKDVIFNTLTPTQLGSIGFYTLNFLWMKFAFIWRFCRLFALIDGVEVPENMLRCWGNNYSVPGFWKSWHSSYNKWIVRYMYVPLGGSAMRFLNVWPIFTFVALWHDITMQLFQWAWIMSLFFLPEFLAELVMGMSIFRGLRKSIHYRHLQAIGGAFNIIMLMIANLVGYGVGTNKVSNSVTEIFSLQGLTTTVSIFTFLYCATQIMMKIRETEKRNEYARHLRLESRRLDGTI